MYEDTKGIIAVLTTSESAALPEFHASNVRREEILIKPATRLLNFNLVSVWRFRELLWFLVWRDIQVRYKQATLGILWAIIQPTLAVLIFTVVFGFFAKFPTGPVAYPVFVFAALLPWTYFSESMRRAAFGLVGDSELIRKVYFPRLIIPLAMVTTPLVDFASSFVVLFAMMLFFGISPTLHLLAVLPLLGLCFLLALALGLFFGPLNVRYRDMMQIVPFVLQIWMYGTPIVYPISMVPAKWHFLYSLNPMVGVIEGFRWAILGQGALNLQAISLSFGATILLLSAGLIFFKKMERDFADII